MAHYCPNCSAELTVSTTECWNCGALFGPNSNWVPTDTPTGIFIARERTTAIPERPAHSGRPTGMGERSDKNRGPRPVRAFFIACFSAAFLYLIFVRPMGWSVYAGALMFSVPMAFLYVFTGAGFMLAVVLLVIATPLRWLGAYRLRPLLFSTLCITSLLYCGLPLLTNSEARAHPAAFVVRQIPQVLIILVTVCIYWFARLPAREQAAEGESERV